MAKISLLPLAGPLNGSETMPIVQSGAMKQAPIADIAEELSGRAATSMKLLEGFDTTLLTGSANAGPGVADGTSLARGWLRVIATPQYDTTYTQLDYWAKTPGGTTGPSLVCLRKNTLGTWDYYSHFTLPPAEGAGARSATFSFSVPGGGTTADTVVCLYEPATSPQIAGAAVATLLFQIADPTAADDISFGSANTRPNVFLTGTYSQIRDKGAVKAGINAASERVRNGLYFVNRGNTAKIRAALAAVRERTGSARVLLCGDSITRGSHTGTNGGLGTYGYSGAYDRCFGAQLLPLMSGFYQQGGQSGLFLPTSYESILGHGNIQGTYTAYNPRLTSAGDWTTVGTVPYTSLGGGLWTSSVTGGAPWTFTPATPVDTFALRTIKRSTSGIVQYRVDGGAWTQIDLAGNNEYLETAIPMALGIHVIEVQHLSGGQVYLHGCLAYDSTTPAVRFVNCGFAGSTAGISWAQVTSNAWSPGKLIGTEPASLKVLAFGTNDLGDGQTSAQFVTGMTALITEAKKLSDVLVLAPPPARTDNSTGGALNGSGAPVANRSLARQREFNAALFAMCKSLDVPLIDQYGWFGEPDTAVNIRGLPLSAGLLTQPLIDDTLHPSYAGATIQMQALYEFFRVVS